MSSPTPGSVRPGNQGPVIGLVALITGILIAGGVTYQLTGGRPRSAAAPGPASTTPAVAKPRPTATSATAGSDGSPTTESSVLLDKPPPGYEEAPRPLGTPPPSRTPTNAFAFTQRRPDGSPVAFDPCRPLHYVIRPDGAPPGGEGLIRDAIRAVSEATGLRIVYDGPTDEEPGADRKSYDRSRRPERWAPVLFAWVGPDQMPQLAGDVAVTTNLQSVTSPDRPAVFVSGIVYLDGPQLTQLLADPTRDAEIRHRMLLATAGMVGLTDTEAPGQVMSSGDPYGRTSYGPGDRFGLAELGTGPCAPWL